MVTNRAVRHDVERLLARSFSSGLPVTVVDLGSGFGIFALFLGRRFPKWTIVGYEVSLVPYWIAQILKMVFGYSNVRFIRQDFFCASIVKADAVYCYLFRAVMPRVGQLVDAMVDSRPSLVISNMFSVPEWKASGIISVLDMLGSQVFIYRVRDVITSFP